MPHHELRPAKLLTISIICSADCVFLNKVSSMVEHYSQALVWREPFLSPKDESGNECCLPRFAITAPPADAEPALVRS
jgi:hypothetical protein